MPAQDRTLTAKLATDLLLWTSATPLAFAFRLDDVAAGEYAKGLLLLTVLLLPAKFALELRFALYRQTWEKAGVRDLYSLAVVVGLVTLAGYAVIGFAPDGFVIPRSVPLIEAMVAFLLLGGVRLGTRMASEHQRGRRSVGKVKRVLIVGAGEAGTMIAREMLRHPEARLHPVGFLDDSPAKRRARYFGLEVLGKIDDAQRIARLLNVDELLIAMPSASGPVVREIVAAARAAGLSHRIIPGIYELLSGDLSISAIREVNLEDLLRREPVRLDTTEISAYLAGRTVLVTGAGGSIGSEIVRQVAGFAPAAVVLLGRGENSVFLIEQEMRRVHPEIPIHPVIADVRDAEKLAEVFGRFRPHVVFHAAAHKHVPLMEANPDQAVFNNIGGTRNLVDLAREFGAERFVNVSTDKAVNPTSVMGATKRVSEFLVHDAGRRADAGQSFVSVRFGNVLGSRGSVVPFFQAQIARGGPVTVTHPEMRRYFMTIPEAAGLVLQAGGMGDNGAVYVLDMGEPVRIEDLARDLILLSGLEPGRDIEIGYTGMRPGEKLFEELLTAEEGTDASTHAKIFTARKSGVSASILQAQLAELFSAAASRDGMRIREMLRAMIPTASFEALAEGHVPQEQALR